jgi:HSP20 family protein
MKSTSREDIDVMASQLSQMMNKLWQWHTGDFCPIDTWSPSINVYRFDKRIELCCDLAGIEPRSIDVLVEPGRLLIRGLRQPPEPLRHEGEGMRILSMEIDHGPFCRTIRLPDQIDLTKVESEYRSGLLWIRLPLREPG